MTWILQLVWAFFGSMGFAGIFNVRGKKLITGSLGGLIAWGVYLFARHWIGSDPICYLIATIVLTVYSETLARFTHTPAILFTISGAIPLIPGGSLYKTMSFAVNSNWDSFFTQGITTLLLAVAIAGGILLTMSIWQVVSNIVRLLHGRKKRS